jgi:hypothetical protein
MCLVVVRITFEDFDEPKAAAVSLKPTRCVSKLFRFKMRHPSRWNQVVLREKDARQGVIPFETSPLT